MVSHNHVVIAAKSRARSFTETTMHDPSAHIPRPKGVCVDFGAREDHSGKSHDQEVCRFRGYGSPLSPCMRLTYSIAVPWSVT